MYQGYPFLLSIFFRQFLKKNTITALARKMKIQDQSQNQNERWKQKWNWHRCLCASAAGAAASAAAFIFTTVFTVVATMAAAEAAATPAGSSVSISFLFSSWIDNFHFILILILYHSKLTGRWPTPSPGYRLACLMALAEAILAENDKNLIFCIKIFWTRPNASERIQMHPKASECIRAHPNRSEQVRKPQKTCKNLEKITKTSRKLSRRLVDVLFCCGATLWSENKWPVAQLSPKRIIKSSSIKTSSQTLHPYGCSE